MIYVVPDAKPDGCNTSTCFIALLIKSGRHFSLEMVWRLKQTMNNFHKDWREMEKVVNRRVVQGNREQQFVFRNKSTVDVGVMPNRYLHRCE